MKSSEKKYALFDDVDLEPSSLELVQKEIGESAESRERCLQLLRKSLTERRDTLYACLEENFLLRFLRVSKFNHKKALNRIQKYYASQGRYLHAFKNHPVTVTEAQVHRYLTASPYRMKNNGVVIISKSAMIDYSKLAFESKLYLDTIVCSKLLTNPLTQMCGVNLIMDGEGFSLQTMRVHTLGRIKLFIDMLTTILPVRAQSLHVVNAPMVFPALFRMMKPFLPKKIQDRMFVHPSDDDWKSLHSCIPKEILPEDYGGDLKPSKMVDLLENLENVELLFREHLKYGFDETEDLRTKWAGIILKN